MACFSASMAAAIVTTVFRKKIPAKYHIEWFNTLVWGGTAGLALEHVAHGEIVPYFPFLTAMANPADAAIMFHEILTVGGAMLLACIATWGIMLYVASYIEQSAKAKTAQTA
jgi:uncharacterized membrane protein